MTNEPDPIETELSALQPHAVSPELRQRIAAQIDGLDGHRDENPFSQKRVVTIRSLSRLFNRRITFLAGSLAAACLAAVVFWWASRHGVDSQAVIDGPQPIPPRAVAGVNAEETQPTLLAYQRALSRSPEELETLLNKHALVMPESDPQFVRIGFSTHSRAALHTLLGDD